MLKEQGFVRVGAVVPKLKVADTEFNCNEIIKQIEVASNNKIPKDFSAVWLILFSQPMQGGPKS